MHADNSDVKFQALGQLKLFSYTKFDFFQLNF